MPIAGTVEDQRDTFVNLLASNWIIGNTPLAAADGFVDDAGKGISTGKWDDRNKRPQVTVPNVDMTEAADTDAYSGMKADGTGPVKRVIGFVVIECSAIRTEVNKRARLVARELANEVNRIITLNFQGTGDLETLKYTGPSSDVDTLANPTVFRELGEGGFTFLETAA